MTVLLVVAVVASGLVGVACGSTSGSTPRELRVPEQYASIAEAVAAATPGSTVVIAPGTYHESVKVMVRGVTIRGEDRNTVILDGRNELLNGFLVGADDVAIENLTVHHFNQNGVMFSGIEAATKGRGADPTVAYGTGMDVLSGYRVSYVTSYDNGLYGIYAFASRDGLIENSYVSGHPDSGVYIGQCKPCNAVIRGVTAERNAIGYYGTNASGGVVIVESTFRNNRLGMAPNSQRMEKLDPQADAVIAGNLIVDNDDPSAPKIPDGYFGGGIAVGGGNRNTIVRNRVVGHDRAGIEVLALTSFLPEGNRVEENVLSGNRYDLVYDATGAKGAAGNCFEDNSFLTSLPADIEVVMPCDGDASTFVVPSLPPIPTPPGVDHRQIPAPPPQPTMPVDRFAMPAGAGAVPTIDLDAITVPS